MKFNRWDYLLAFFLAVLLAMFIALAVTPWEPR